MGLIRIGFSKSPSCSQITWQVSSHLLLITHQTLWSNGSQQLYHPAVSIWRNQSRKGGSAAHSERAVLHGWECSGNKNCSQAQLKEEVTFRVAKGESQPSLYSVGPSQEPISDFAGTKATKTDRTTVDERYTYVERYMTRHNFSRSIVSHRKPNSSPT